MEVVAPIPGHGVPRALVALIHATGVFAVFALPSGCGGAATGPSASAPEFESRGQSASMIVFYLPTNHGELRPVPPPGRASVVDYWAPSCEPCRKTLPELVRRRPELEARGVELVLVGVLAESESTEFGERTLALWGVPGEHFLVDRGDASAREGGVTTLPATQVFDARGALRWTALLGATVDDVMRAAEAVR